MNKRSCFNRNGYVAVVIAVLIAVGGCVGPFDTDPMVDLRVPEQRLREIEPLELVPMDDDPAAEAPTPPVPPAELELTLEECRALALTNNLDLRVELLDPTIAETFITEEEARFESLFFTDIDYARTDTPTATELEGSETDSVGGNLGVDVPLRTGGNLRFNFLLNRFETNNQFSTLNPSYTSDFAVSLSHNLLRNAGRRTNMHPIRVAYYQDQQVEAQTKLEVIRVLANVDRAYWLLYAVRRELAVRVEEHDLAIAQLERAERQLKAGVVAEIEVLRAEVGVAETLESIIIAENQVRDAQRLVKRIINRPDVPQGSATVLVPHTEPDPIRYAIDTQQLVDQALHDRMEMLELELQLAIDASTIDFARNQTLPLAAFDYTYSLNGLGGDLSGAFESLGDFNSHDHFLGMRVEVPLGNEAAKSRLHRAVLSRLQRLATRQQREAAITQEVLNAADALDANWQRVLAARQRTVLAGRSLLAEQRQFDLGLRTSNDVLDAQARFADAQSAEVRALTDYEIARVDLAFATGSVLGATRVVWEPTGREVIDH